MSELVHTSVLAHEVLSVLDPKAGETVLDCTVGFGGHAALFGKAIGTTGTLIGLDADSDNIVFAQKNLKQAGIDAQIYHTNFAQIPHLQLPQVDVLFADLGLSSAHLDDPSRGFSFRFDGPLDLRFDRTQGETAAEMIVRLKEEELADLFFRYGELRQSRRIAAFIKEEPPVTTKQLVTRVEKAIGWKAKSMHAQVFQSLRIAVNHELEALETLLHHGISLLKPNGRMGIISFHSLEDRLVKQFFKTLTTPSKDPITGADSSVPDFVMLTKKAVVPTDNEIENNPRARSARFRAIAKVPSHFS